MGAVKSSVFQSVDYLPDATSGRGTLTVTMHGGRSYHHDGVPETVASQMMKAPSLGAFYNAEIKKSYPPRKG